MAAFKIDTLIRQLANTRNGVSRRTALIDDAMRKVERMSERAFKERAALEKEIGELEMAKVELAELRRIHCVNRQKGAVSASEPESACEILDERDVEADLRRRNCVSKGGALVIDGAFPHRATADGMMWAMPLGFPAGETPEIEKQETGSALSMIERAVAIPGYSHLGYLVQAQWMTAAPLERAAALCEQRANHGAGLAPDLVAHVIDGKASGRAGDGFWSDRKASLEASADEPGVKQKRDI